jgi:hypothetical protein
MPEPIGVPIDLRESADQHIWEGGGAQTHDPNVSEGGWPGGLHGLVCHVGGWDRADMEAMMRYETTTTLAQEAALAAAEQFFGGEFGLTVRQRGSQVIRFEGAGGYVLVSLTGERPTTLELETREWDRQVTQFMERLPR